MCLQTDEASGIVHLKHRPVDVSQPTAILEGSARYRVYCLQLDRSAGFANLFHLGKKTNYPIALNVAW